ncbi:hypothetical protein M407DRAFT_158776 [Tulasnella calospora MUT 4182]|uniref:Uncharacterized protein n=1 Tax=Tulasnella calospora MUT 4182 TaxID=1051891 RepID=A0A0C3KAQ6_9AGAM|nr:hypothetical protein M407DRAFT_158776 [Tulasnella calospora MUT 4182]
MIIRPQASRRPSVWAGYPLVPSIAHHSMHASRYHILHTSSIHAAHISFCITLLFTLFHSFVRNLSTSNPFFMLLRWFFPTVVHRVSNVLHVTNGRVCDQEQCWTVTC